MMRYSKFGDYTVCIALLVPSVSSGQPQSHRVHPSVRTPQSLACVRAFEQMKDLETWTFKANYRQRNSDGTHVTGVAPQDLPLRNRKVEIIELPSSNAAEDYGLPDDLDIRTLRVGEEFEGRFGDIYRVSTEGKFVDGIYHPPDLDVLDRPSVVFKNGIWIDDTSAKVTRRFTTEDLFDKSGDYSKRKYPMMTASLEMPTRTGRPHPIKVFVPYHDVGERYNSYLGMIKSAQMQIPRHLADVIDEVIVVPGWLWSRTTDSNFPIDEGMLGQVKWANSRQIHLALDDGKISPNTYWHEWAHALAGRLNRRRNLPLTERFDPPEAWQAALAKDKAQASVYAGANFAEDFAESVNAYIATDGGRLNGMVRRGLEHRFKILDQIFHPSFRLDDEFPAGNARSRQN